MSKVYDVLCDGIRRLCQNDSRVENLIAPRFTEIITQLTAYIDQIELYNRAWGLVGTNDRRELIVRHILDSLAPLGIISGLLADAGKTRAGQAQLARQPHIAQQAQIARQLKVADVGSGAGLPGIPLAVVLPHVQFTLIERSGRRANFLRNTLAELAPANITVEEAEMEKVKPHRFDAVTFRAFRTLEPKILKKLQRLCRENGVLAAYKGRLEKITAEMAALEKTFSGYGGHGLAGNWECIPCPVPGLDEERHLVIIQITTNDT